MVTGDVAPESDAGEQVVASVAAPDADVVEDEPVDDEQAASRRAVAASGARTAAARDRQGGMRLL